MEDSILFIAKDLFYNKGYFKTKISDITEKRGIASGSFYRYFNSKEDLLREILKIESTEYIEKLNHLTALPDRIDEKIKKILDTNLALIFEKPHFLALIEDIQLNKQKTQSSTKRILNSISAANVNTLKKILSPTKFPYQKKELICQLISTTIVTYNNNLIKDSDGNCCPEKIALLNIENKREELTLIVTQMCKGFNLSDSIIQKKDEDTRTYTREYFIELFSKTHDIYSKKNLPLYILYLDLPSLVTLEREKNFFLKNILNSLGDTLHHLFRSGDIIGRVTDSSFMVILPDYKTGFFEALLKRLRTKEVTLLKKFPVVDTFFTTVSIISIPTNKAIDITQVIDKEKIRDNYLCKK